MIIIHSMNEMLPRAIADRLTAALRVMPAVVLTGARQTGKSTLVKHTGPEPRRFASLDDFDLMAAARNDPQLLVAGDEPITLDEVQRAPDLLSAVKIEIDRARRPGRFLLTGSANLLLMQRISESLAGRASYLDLWPMARREQMGLGQCGVWDALLAHPDAEWPDLLLAQQAPVEDWRLLAQRGGLPDPAVHLNDAEERRIWFEGYVRTYLERDLLDLSNITALPDFRRLGMTARCWWMGCGMRRSTSRRGAPARRGAGRMRCTSGCPGRAWCMPAGAGGWRGRARHASTCTGAWRHWKGRAT